MKQITIFLLLTCFGIKAQVFTGSGGLIQDNGQDTYFTLSVAGLPQSQLDSVYGLEQVCVNITHPNITELYIYLRSPSGTLVNLSLGSSVSGANYTSTCFNNQSATSITLGTSPYTGVYIPVGQLGRFNTGQAGNGNWQLMVHDGFAFINAGNLISWSLQFGSNPARPVAFKSSNLPIVLINTTQPITLVKSLAGMGIINNGPNRNYLTDAWNNYNGKIQVKLRGTSSLNFEKNSMGFETSDASGNDLASSLLGMPLEVDWTLVACYQDKSLLRNPLTYHLFGRMGHYSPRFREVELVLDNEYRGVYALVEKPKRDVNRINIEKLTTSENTLPAMSGGYILKIDRTDEAGWLSLLPGNSQANAHFHYEYVYPKDTIITVAQQNYIKNYMDSMETAINSATFADPMIGYRKYLEINSFIDFFIMNEFAKNPDGYRLSTFLYKNHQNDGGKVSIGPVWDFDLAWHNCNYGNAFIATDWQYQIQDNVNPSPTWWGRFMQDTAFVNALNCRWTELRQTYLSIPYLHNYIDSSANVLSESQQRNFVQWPILGAYIEPNPQSQVNASYWGEVNDLKNWISNRVAWLDVNITGSCNVSGSTVPTFVNNLKVFPNPMGSQAVFALQLKEEADISLCITDVMGKEIKRVLNSHVARGESTIIFERDQLAAGIYFYQVQVNDTVRKGKLVIQ